MGMTHSICVRFFMLAAIPKLRAAASGSIDCALCRLTYAA
jgi:hypothetical protein